ncbi:acyl-CoA dehydrogenase family member 11-like [Pollicipes pollicipes]|uniref:acyl-CoA dehydrogenase family member 11-like n=1 Tax=Pollicipes pollicipes TaxID=41117 RepID=UPI001884D22E|nr:acyl-CoA dehydrogenase family member 11-like [Pollicipes pollicipes]XP_037091503.1 acyl-CoA dehydrogenase family member 11-like [Pollicipes pollicipes]
MLACCLWRVCGQSPRLARGRQPSDALLAARFFSLSRAERGAVPPVSRANLGVFCQQPHQLTNTYLGDPTLAKYLRRLLPREVFEAVDPDLERFGERCATDIYKLGLDCENNPPKLETFNAWGERIDKLVTCHAWTKMKTIAAEELLIESAYRRNFAEHSRLYQMAKVFLFNPSSGLYSCPLAMTDGAAKTLEGNSSRHLKMAYEHLTSRNPAKFWTSGQWMTEKRGGSDVATGTETVAVPHEGGTYRLYGVKWFSSATDADVCLTLARTLDPSGRPVQGSGGLSMYFVETRHPSGKLNNIEIIRLKNKLGTRQLPTAELLLDGTVARRVGEDGRGVANIAVMLTVTRLHNAVSSVAVMRRVLQLARDYSRRRTAFGRPVGDWPLHTRTLALMEVETRACQAFLLQMVSLQGRDDVGAASDSDRLLLRLLMPVIKLYTAKQAVWTASEGLESFGGQGYIEDTGLPGLLRDSQVLPIWEGTTNVLSMDVLRALRKTGGEAWRALAADVAERLLPPAAAHPRLRPAVVKVKQILPGVEKFMKENQDSLDVAARDLAFTIAKTYMCALLCHHAAGADGDAEDLVVAERWASQELAPLLTERARYQPDQLQTDAALVMAGHGTSRPAPDLTST